MATIRRMELLAYGRSSVIIAFDSDHKSREGFVLLCGVLLLRLSFDFSCASELTQLNIKYSGSVRKREGHLSVLSSLVVLYTWYQVCENRK